VRGSSSSRYALCIVAARGICAAMGLILTAAVV
jgi:hypothetical protein